MKTHSWDKILNYLKVKKGTYKQIAQETGLSYDGVRGRISELRDLGFPIEKKNNDFYMTDTRQLIPFNFELVPSPNGTKILIISIPLDFYGKIQNTDELLDEFKQIIKKCQDLIQRIKDNKDKNKIKDKLKDVQLNWEIGDLLYTYQNKLIKNGLFCWNYENILEKYIGKAGKGGTHRREYWRIRKEFRRDYPNKEKLFPIGFNIYNEIIVVSDGKKRKQLEKFVIKRFTETNSVPTINEIRDKRHKIGGTKKGRNLLL